MKMKLDRISNLPSDVIEKILSHLPIRETVRTCVLSTKWRYKWAMLPDLSFDDQCISITENHTITNIVDHVLLLHIGPIHKFKLSRHFIIASSDIDRWILHLSRISIKELILEIWDGPYYKVPSFLFSCQDMIHLELYRCILKPSFIFKGFRSLKSLNMENVTLAQDVFENLVACPLLGKLILLNCDGFSHLKIDAPNLQILIVLGVFGDFILENTLNLADVDMGANLDQRQVSGSSTNMVNFSVHLPQIRRLLIHNNFLKYLAVGALPGELPKPFLYLNYLYIQICFNDVEQILTALCLLRSSPALQGLEIAPQEDQAVVGEVNSKLDDNQNCPLTQLRFVKITDISGVKAELDFIKLLLLSSPVLERMTIKPASVNGFAELVKELLRFRRSSAHAEIIYMDP